MGRGSSVAELLAPPITIARRGQKPRPALKAVPKGAPRPLRPLRRQLEAQDFQYLFKNIPDIKKFVRDRGAKNYSNLTRTQLNELLVDYFDYERDREVLREAFRATEKYALAGAAAEQAREAWDLMLEYGFDPHRWSFPASTRAFDRMVSRHLAEKDKKRGEVSLLDAVVKIISDSAHHAMRKEYTKKRNDFVERLVFDTHPEVIPTPAHHKDVDYYIDGVPYDQKVSRPGNAFLDTYQDGWREAALANPEEVALSLYNNQGDERFSVNNRVFFIELDDDLTDEEIAEQVAAVSFDKPSELVFEGETLTYFVFYLQKSKATA